MDLRVPRTSIPGATYSESEAWSVGLFSAPGQVPGGFSGSLEPQKDRTVHRLVWPEEETPQVYSMRDAYQEAYRGDLRSRAARPSRSRPGSSSARSRRPGTAGTPWSMRPGRSTPGRSSRASSRGALGARRPVRRRQPLGRGEGLQGLLDRPPLGPAGAGLGPAAVLEVRDRLGRAERLAGQLDARRLSPVEGAELARQGHPVPRYLAQERPAPERPLPLPLRLPHRPRGPQERGPGRLQPRPRRAGLLRGLRPGRPVRPEAGPSTGRPPSASATSPSRRMRADGRLGKAWTNDGKLVDPEGTIGAFLIPPLVTAFRATHKAAYLEAAEKAYAFYIGEFVRTASRRPGPSTRTASTRSRRRRSSRPPSSSTTSPGRTQYLKWAEDVSYYLATWQWHYCVPYPEGTVAPRDRLRHLRRHGRLDPAPPPGPLRPDHRQRLDQAGRAHRQGGLAGPGPRRLGQRDDRHLGRRPRRHGQKAALRQPGRGLPPHALAPAVRRQPVARRLADRVPSGNAPPESAIGPSSTSIK